MCGCPLRVKADLQRWHESTGAVMCAASDAAGLAAGPDELRGTRGNQVKALRGRTAINGPLSSPAHRSLAVIVASAPWPSPGAAPGELGRGRLGGRGCGVGPSSGQQGPGDAGHLAG
jgi:hypothetical protein